jgi:hypothetical protein
MLGFRLAQRVDHFRGTRPIEHELAGDATFAALLNRQRLQSAKEE